MTRPGAFDAYVQDELERRARDQYATYLKALPHGALRLEFEDFCEQIDAMKQAAESRVEA